MYKRQALVYPGTCLFEGTTVSEGRGTACPFEMIGAPFVDGAALAGTMNREGLPGVIDVYKRQGNGRRNGYLRLLRPDRRR